MKELYSRSLPARILHVVIHAVFGLAAAALFALLFGLVVMHLWNWLMPELAGAGRIGFWQAFGLIVLARLLVGGIHHGVRGEDRWRGRFSPFYPVPDEARARRKEYREFWHREGRAAFEEYLRRRDESPDGGLNNKSED